jgi:GTP cyclohydrolase I
MAENRKTEYVRQLVGDKTDPELGKQVCAFLGGKGLIPTIDEGALSPSYNPELAVHQLETGIYGAFMQLGIDMRNDPSMRDTPKRYAKMMVGELTRGLNFDFFPKFTTFPSEGYNQMVFLGKIQTISLCEHHLQTIYGDTFIAYLPGKEMCGVSKLARVTDFFARRPQVQERMTEQIYWALSHLLGTEDVAVVQKCAHYCMRARGSLQHASVMDTNKMGGKFMDNPALRQEFLDACRA